MKKNKVIISTFILTAIFSCAEIIKDESRFPEVKNLTEYKNTTFIPTLEHKISNDKNSVYCATLLFAWEEIRNQINAPLTIPDEHVDLNLLNKSTSFKNVLKNEEYEASGQVENGVVKASAAFSKSLPFSLKLENFKNNLVFDGQKVASFGVNGYSDYDQLNLVQIVYYKNDNNFIIKLLPKVEEHEIILFKTDKKFNSMTEMTKEIERLTEIGKTEKKNEKMRWKYYYDYEDVVIIPKFSFNIETNYPSLVGTNFSTSEQDFQIKEAWQRTAFVLDESGAEIESEAVMETTEEGPAEEKPKPKKMIFDQPFLILLKRVDNTNPYFGLWTTNTELMIKE
ncbi:MAG: hypothetical protein IT222_10370 [Crocinitomix sp.]|nr:hypothetical protein [Crocinitomix sp.]